MLRGIFLLILLVVGSANPLKAAGSVHEFSLTAIEGGPLALDRFAGQPILLVNTASFCGFTYQYEQLQEIWERYRDRGLIVLGVPSNDFGRQEPGSAEEIAEFCEVNFAVTFPMSDKVSVKGPESIPLFAFIREKLGPAVGPDWNFNKYLIDRNGQPIAHWPSSVRPDDPRIVEAIEAIVAGS